MKTTIPTPKHSGMMHGERQDPERGERTTSIAFYFLIGLLIVGLLYFLLLLLFF